MDTKSLLEYNVDKTQVPAIDQKRIVAFINHFVVNTVTFLNQFALNCETKFVDFESKLMQMESSLSILESKLESIPDLDRSHVTVSVTASESGTASQPPEPQPEVATSNNDHDVNESQTITASDSANNNDGGDDDKIDAMPAGIRACEDMRYKKYFKMVQFGVPAAAVKLKMEAEGLDGSLLDDPNRLVSDDIVD